MPHPEVDDRHQYAVLWTRAGYNKFGEPKLNAPIEIKVRWEDQIGLAFDTGDRRI